MSRSRKKPYITDQQSSNINKWSKRKANKAVRRHKDADDAIKGKQYRKLSNSWDIRDYSFHCPKLPKAYRK